ncbi:MAG: hypothetical protein JW922_03095 [Paludibacteraceae bacterium]|nr:hypothetical protein [Paludibacteraceae bacterium]
MKKTYSLLVVTAFSFLMLYAQTPNRINYQAIIRIGEQNTLVANTSISVKISILQGNENGVSVYTEKHTPTTNANGLMTLSIGGGAVQSGSFTSINWANGPYFVKTEIDPEGGNNYLLSSTTQLLTVPYALHAKTAETISGSIPFDKITNTPATLSGDYNDLTNKPTLFSGNYNDLTNKPTLATVSTTGSYNDLTDKPIIGANGFSGNYADLSGKPNFQDSITSYGFSGNYNDLTNKPTFVTSYLDLTNKPNLATVATSGSYNDLTDKPIIGANGFSGNYADLSGKPNIQDSIATYSFSGNYNELQNKPVLFSGSYNDLTDIPSSFAGNYSELTNKPSFPDSIATYGFNGNYQSLINTPNIPDTITKYAFDGDYNNLTNKPEQVSSFNNDAGYITNTQVSGKLVPQGASIGDILYWNGNEGWNIVPIGEEGQMLSIKNGKPTWINNVLFNNYQVGDLFLEDGNSVGIIADIAADGSEGILISTDEFSGKSWGRIDTLLHCSSADGYTNTNTIRSVWNYSQTTFPATQACVSLGADEWYLPSKEEMIRVYSNRNFINKRLEALEKTKLGETANAYWTSSEKDTTSALIIQFNTIGTSFAGNTIEIEKDSTCHVRAMRKLNAQEIKSRPADYHFYAIGDVFYENNQPKGIVYTISDGGLHGKVVSISQERSSWMETETTPTTTNATSLTNGKANLDSIKATVPYDIAQFSYPPGYPIFWAYSLGTNWYTPATNELTELYLNKTIINTALNQLIVQNIPNVSLLQATVETSFYWSSTEQNDINAYSISFENGTQQQQPKTTNSYIRAIRNF